MYKSNYILLSAVILIFIMMLLFFSMNVNAAYITDGSNKRCEHVNLKNSLDLKYYEIKVCFVDLVVYGSLNQGKKSASGYWTFYPPENELAEKVEFSTNVKFSSSGPGDLYVASPKDIGNQTFEKYHESREYQLSFYGRYKSPKSFLTTLAVKDVINESRDGHVDITVGNNVKSDLRINFKSIIGINSLNSYCLIKVDRRFGSMKFRDFKPHDFKYAKFNVRGHGANSKNLVLKLSHISQNNNLIDGFSGYESRNLKGYDFYIPKNADGTVTYFFGKELYLDNVEVAPRYSISYLDLQPGEYEVKTRVTCD